MCFISSKFDFYCLSWRTLAYMRTLEVSSSSHFWSVTRDIRSCHDAWNSLSHICHHIRPEAASSRDGTKAHFRISESPLKPFPNYDCELLPPTRKAPNDKPTKLKYLKEKKTAAMNVTYVTVIWKRVPALWSRRGLQYLGKPICAVC